jgi:hypothetical protein
MDIVMVFGKIVDSARCRLCRRLSVVIAWLAVGP